MQSSNSSHLPTAHLSLSASLVDLYLGPRCPTAPGLPKKVEEEYTAIPDWPIRTSYPGPVDTGGEWEEDSWTRWSPSKASIWQIQLKHLVWFFHLLTSKILISRLLKFSLFPTYQTANTKQLFSCKCQTTYYGSRNGLFIQCNKNPVTEKII